MTVDRAALPIHRGMSGNDKNLNRADEVEDVGIIKTFLPSLIIPVK